MSSTTHRIAVDDRELGWLVSGMTNVLDVLAEQFYNEVEGTRDWESAREMYEAGKDLFGRLEAEEGVFDEVTERADYPGARGGRA